MSKAYTFNYKGHNNKGKHIKGNIKALNIAVAKALLRKQGIIPRKINKQRLFFWNKHNKKITYNDITLFTRQVATMLAAGIPFLQALDIMTKSLDHGRLKALINKIRKNVADGHTLYEALKQEPIFFNKLYCSLIAAGEQSGALDSILDKLATHREKIDSIKAKIKKALYYPIAVILVAWGVTTIMLIFVVPQFETLFKDFGAPLPLFTRFVVLISQYTQSYWWIMLMCALVGIGGFMIVKRRSKTFSNRLERLSLKLPIIGALLEKAAIARFARTLATLFAAGIPLTDALKSVANATANIVFTEATAQISTDIAKGQTLQQAIAETGLFPQMVIQMVATGEESGALEKMLTKVADFYEEEVDNKVDGLSSLIEPLIMATLGVLIGGLVVAMYLPIFKLGSVV